MPVSQSRFISLEALPGSRRCGANFCVRRREGGRDHQGGRSQPSSRRGPNGRGAFADFEIGGRRAVPGGASTPGREGRPVSRGQQGSGCANAKDPRCSVRSSGRARERSRSRRSTMADGRAAALLDHCTPREAAKLFGEPGGMNPSSSCALVRRAVSGRKRSRKPWTARRKPAKPCAVSLDGVPLRPDGDEEACRASCGTVSFQDAEGRKRSVSGRKSARRRRNSQVAHVRKVRPELVAVADAAPDNRTFLEKLRRTGGRLFSCASQRGFRPSRPTGAKSTVPSCATTSTASTRSRYLRDKATTKPEVLRRELGFFRKHGHRMREPQGQRLRAPASSANKVLVNQRMKRTRWSMRSECPHPRWSDRSAWRLEPRTKRRTPLDGENPAVKTGSLAKIEPHPLLLATTLRQRDEAIRQRDEARQEAEASRWKEITSAGDVLENAAASARATSQRPDDQPPPAEPKPPHDFGVHSPLYSKVRAIFVVGQAAIAFGHGGARTISVSIIRAA